MSEFQKKNQLNKEHNDHLLKCLNLKVRIDS